MTATNHWRLEQGDVDSAFLNDTYLEAGRNIYFKAPKGGLPAAPGTKWAHIPEGTIIKAKKGIYGLNDAPLRWFTEHKDTILKLEGAERSKLNPALFLFRDDQGAVVGMIAVHVDDDLIAGSEELFENQVEN